MPAGHLEIEKVGREEFYRVLYKQLHTEVHPIEIRI
jgi:hypothetical protein